MRPQLNPLILGPGAPWSLPGSSLDIQFTTGRAAVNRQKASISSLLTTTRASTGYASTSTGSLTLFQANVPRITDLGLLVEQAATNKNTNTNLNPQDLTNVSVYTGTGTLSVVSDTAALAAIGLTGNVFKLDNSAGVTSSGVEIQGNPGDTNPHVYSTYVRGTAAGFRIGPVDDLGLVAITAAYSRAAKLSTPSNTTRTLRLRVDAGETIFFILNQLEESGFITSPIPVAGVAVTRAADAVTFNSLSLPAPYSMVVSVGSSASTSADLFLGGTVNDGSLLRINSGGGIANVNEAGVATASVTAGTVTANTAFKMAARFAVNDTNLAVGGTLGTHDTSTTPPTLTALGFGRALYSFGSAVGSVYFKRTTLFRSGLPDAQLTAQST